MPAPREINSGACMLARLAYLLHVVGAVSAVFCAVGGAVLRDPALLARAVLLLAITLGLRAILRRTGWLGRCRDSFDELGGADPGEGGEEPDARLRALLVERAAMEERRGTPAFDPWAFLALQHEINARLETRGGGPHPERGANELS